MGEQTQFYWREEVYLAGRYRIELPFKEFKPTSMRRDHTGERQPCKDDQKYRRVFSFSTNLIGYADDEPLDKVFPPGSTSGWFDKRQ